MKTLVCENFFRSRDGDLGDPGAGCAGPLVLAKYP